jgi:hypothetical protein
VTAFTASPLQVRIGRRQTRKSKWDRAQIAVRRSKPDTLVSPSACPAKLIELLLVQRMERVDYPEFPNRAILLGCSLLRRRSAFISGQFFLPPDASEAYALRGQNYFGR